VLYQVIKDDQFRDDPPNPEWVPALGPYNKLLHVYSMDRPEVHEVVAQMRAVLDDYADRVMIAEVWLPLERLVTYYGTDGDGTHLPLNFQLIQLPWTPAFIREAIRTYEDLLPRGGWPNWVLGNHDTHRIASRIGPSQVRVAAMLLLLLRGTPTLYYGDEIGMTDVPITADRVQDPFEKNVPGLGLGRDPARTPMQWDDSLQAGFTAAWPWLPIAENHKKRNVAVERADSGSLLTLYRALIELRRSEPALSVGAYREYADSHDALTWVRSHGGKEFLVAVNLGHEPATVDLGKRHGTVRLTTQLDGRGDRCGRHVTLQANEGLVIELEDRRR
jgi:alpha-glucosidase